jgi:hypothetical protein
MKRRTFLQSTLAASCLPLSAGSTVRSAAANQTGRQVLDWRRYVISSEDQQAKVSSFLRTAALPALERLSVGPVGVFTEIGAEATFSVYTLTAFDSLAEWVGLSDRMASDQEFLAAARDYLSTDKDAPAYDRMENQLMVAFAGYPRVKTPRSGERIFELRVYESHNEYQAKLKIEMFNEAELSIFEKVGLEGVFFGETLVGRNLPNLTYMLAYQDMAEHDQAWQAFRTDPDWGQLKERERYRDTVSNIVSRFLQPAPYSQI